MVTTKKAAAPGTEAVAKRTVAKPAAAKPVTAKPKAAAKTATAVSPLKTAPAIPKKAAVRKKAATPAKSTLSAAQRAKYVEVAAFYIAERRGFAGANPADDWAAAEAEIENLIVSGHFSP